ncbi:hypothetical protein [Parendozoicomonas haliclonae]|uniref:Uncharacterized protein n=1 Tax=Parendozoicomonas haliclonae TaxID=1960125 RepID=A0A1X7AQN2_9GAMM|nr:hypothetical protein [Parendozoicomonas haliclonae]SMA50545.1 hypothetical protein EHSB41UT_04356 [Parendozoicomonas haliclonae]
MNTESRLISDMAASPLINNGGGGMSSASSSPSGEREGVSPVSSSSRQSPEPDRHQANGPANESLMERSVELSSTGSPSLIPETPEARTARFFEGLNAGLKYQFERQGLKEKHLTPLIRELGVEADDEAIWSALDKVHQEMVNEPKDEQLNHHRVHRGVLGAIALFGNGSNRWFGLAGLAAFLPIPPFAKMPLSIAITGLAYISDGLQGAFGVNRLRLEGPGTHPGFYASGILAFCSTSAIAGMAYRGMIQPLGYTGALVVGAMKLVGSFPFYHILANRSTYGWMGMDQAKEERVERSVHLLKEALEQLGKDVSLADEGAESRKLAYRKVLKLEPDSETRFQKLLRWTCLAAPGDKAKNTIREIRQAGLNDKGIRQLASDARLSRSQWSWPWLTASFVGLAVLTGISSWGEAATVINPLIAFTSVGASPLAVAGIYIGWQVIFAAFMAGRSLGQAALVKDNLKVFGDSLKKLGRKMQQGPRAVMRDMRSYCEALWQCGSVQQLLKSGCRKTVMLVGVLSSICYALSFAGAINSNAGEDIVLERAHVAGLLLTLAGSLTMLVATARMGHELQVIVDAVAAAAVKLARKGQKMVRPVQASYSLPVQVADDDEKMPLVVVN